MEKYMNYKTHSFKILFAITLALLWCIPSMAQVFKGSISGTVADPTGSAVAGAQIRATNADTGATFTTTSDSSGLFRLNLLPIGTYTVEITTQGFKTTQDKGVVLSSGDDNNLGSLRLTAGEPSTIVEVSAEAPLIQTQSQVSTTVSGATLNSFAGIQEREGLDALALFSPGIVSARSDNFSNTNGGEGLSNNGLRGRNNDQQIDGQSNNENSVAGPWLILSDPNFVQQYTTVTSNFGPEYGRNSGSVVNLVSRAGSNEWHGSIYGSENNSFLNALSNGQKHSTNLNGTPLTGPPRSNDEFGGGTIGGPILKNKLFLFNGFDQEIISGNSYTSRTDPIGRLCGRQHQCIGRFEQSRAIQFQHRQPDSAACFRGAVREPLHQLQLSQCTVRGSEPHRVDSRAFL
jgi:hypothetical protein